MKYLVLETHPAYAILLDQTGRFVKAANRHYQVGETVQNVLELRDVPGKSHIRLYRRLSSGLAAAAACFCLVYFGYYRPNFTAYGTVRMQINPDVEMTISKTEKVLDLEGLNEDGRNLVSDYEYQGKDREQASEELIQLAMEMGYLTEGGTVAFTLDTQDSGWLQAEEEKTLEQMEERFGETIVIQIGPMAEEEPIRAEEEVEVVIPLPTQTETPTPAETAAPTPVWTAPPATPEPVYPPETDDDDDDDGDDDREDDNDDWEDDGSEEDDD